MQIEKTITYHDKEKTKIESIIYHKKGDKDYWHNENEPAYIEYNENGNKKYEAYYLNNKLQP